MALSESSVAAKPTMRGVNVAPRPDACEMNSCHQFQFARSAAAAASRLLPRCVASALRITIAKGTAAAKVRANTPSRIAGARRTRRQPSTQAMVGPAMSGEETVGEHQLLQPHHPAQGPLQAGLTCPRRQ